MLRLNDIMTRDVVTVPPELSLRDAMSLFTTRHISGAPVVTNGKIVGVVSLTDLAEFAAASTGVPTQRPELAEWEEWDEPRDLPEGSEPPSMFFSEMWDDAGAEADERMKASGGPEWNVLDEHTVSEVMSRRVCALAPHTAVDFAADYMRTAGIHRVLVMDDDRLAGLVSTSDIAAAVADEKITRRVFVFDTAASRSARRK